MNRSSGTLRRIRIAALGLLVVIYLSLITVSYVGQLQSSKRIFILGFLWLLGLVAIALLVRAWRHLTSSAR